MTHFIAVNIFLPILFDDAGNEDIEPILATQFFIIEQKFQALTVIHMKRTPRGLLAVFENTDPLPGLLEMQSEFSKYVWKTYGKATLQLAVHSEKPGQWWDDFRGPEFDHVSALLAAARLGQILLTEQAASQLAPPPGYLFKDLGVHSLNDLSEPKTLYSLRPAGSAVSEDLAPRSLKSYPQNLPSQATPFYGREEELAEITSCLLNPTTRLLTLAGPGGFGKTRLGLKVASQLVTHFPNGVYFVPLAQLSTDSHMVTSLAHAVGFTFTGMEDSQRQLIQFLAGKKMLILLDNFEHILDGAVLVDALLKGAPGLKALVTTREKLRLEDEIVIEVKGLSYPMEEHEGEAVRYSAVRLFLRSARAVAAPDFNPSPEELVQVARISRFLEGMPLGIELASAWVKSLPVSEIAAKISTNRDFVAAEMPYLPARHQSLRAIFEYSWDLLSAVQRRALKTASVFKGGFTLEAAAHVGAVPLSVWPQLTEKYLVTEKSKDHYELHDLVRYYAKEKLFENPVEKEQVLDAHCEYLAVTLRQKEKELQGPRRGKAMEFLLSQMGNIRDGWRRAVEKGQENRIEDYLDCLFDIYQDKGWSQEGSGVFEEAGKQLLEKAGGRANGKSALLIGKIYSRWASLLQQMGRMNEALMVFQGSLKFLKPTKSLKQVAFCYNGLGVTLTDLAQDKKARNYFNKALRIYQKAKDPSGTARLYNNLGHNIMRAGNFRQARILIQKALTYFESGGDLKGTADSYILLGTIQHDMGDNSSARALFQKALGAYVECDNRRGMAWAFTNMGEVAEAVGDFNGAKEMYQEGLGLHEGLGDRKAMGWSKGLLAWINWAIGDYAKAKQYAKSGFEDFRFVKDVRGEAWALELQGNLAVSEGDFKGARQFYNECHDLVKTKEILSMGKAWHLYHLGDLLSAEGKLDAAYPYLKKSLAMFQTIGENIGIITALTQLAEVEYEKGMMGKARNRLVKTFEKALATHSLPHLTDAMVVLAQWLIAQNINSNAFAYLTLAVSHPTCRRQTKDRAAKYLTHLQYRLPPGEVEKIFRWSKTVQLEEVAQNWLTEQEKKPKGKGVKTRAKKTRNKAKKR